MRHVYLDQQFNSAANPLVFVLTSGNSLMWMFYGKLWEAKKVKEAWPNVFFTKSVQPKYVDDIWKY